MSALDRFHGWLGAQRMACASMMTRSQRNSRTWRGAGSQEKHGYRNAVSANGVDAARPGFRAVSAARKWFVPADKVEREHFVEIGIRRARMVLTNCLYSHKSCHAVVTNGTKATTAGSTAKQRIAKVKRLRGETFNGPKKQISPRPFQKKSRPMSRTRYDNTKYLDRYERP